MERSAAHGPGPRAMELGGESPQLWGHGPSPASLAYMVIIGTYLRLVPCSLSTLALVPVTLLSPSPRPVCPEAWHPTLGRGSSWGGQRVCGGLARGQRTGSAGPCPCKEPVPPTPKLRLCWSEDAGPSDMHPLCLFLRGTA